jgi:hypothetical protein
MWTVFFAVQGNRVKEVQFFAKDGEGAHGEGITDLGATATDGALTLELTAIVIEPDLQSGKSLVWRGMLWRKGLRYQSQHLLPRKVNHAKFSAVSRSGQVQFLGTAKPVRAISSARGIAVGSSPAAKG